MSVDLVFTMGKIPAPLPGNLLYARNHMWAKPVDGSLRHGFTSYAILLMKDVYFLEWHLEEGDEVGALQEIGHIETSKAESSLYCPAGGKVVRFNKKLLDDPATINTDGYGEGWLFDLEGGTESYMDAPAYLKYLEDNWEKTQVVLKGKMNQIDDSEDGRE